MNVNAANFDPNTMGYNIDPGASAGDQYGDGAMYGQGAAAPPGAPDMSTPYAYDSSGIAVQSGGYNPYAPGDMPGGVGSEGTYMASDPAAALYGGGAQHPQIAMEQQHYVDHHQDQTESAIMQGADPVATDVMVPGMYYQTGHFAPQNIDGAPISAIALDHHSQAMYIASHTQRIGSGGMVANTHPHAKTTPFDQSSNTTNASASMLVTHSTTDGMLYSSCAGHPQADLSILQNLNKLMYGGGASLLTSTSTSSSAAGSASSSTIFSRRVPPHAYIPPFGVGHASATATAATATSTSTTVVGSTATPSLNESLYNSYQMGINTLLPFSNGYVASVSPATVRVHNQGGLLVSDSNLRGMVKGCSHPSVHGVDGAANMTHITVGGMIGGRTGKDSTSNSTSTTASMSRQHLHCLDLYQNLRPVSSHGLKHNNKGGGDLAVTALATNHETKSIVAGCTDGTIRILDGSWRKRGGIEVAKVKSHMGGVTDISVSDDGRLICTAGFSARASLDSVRPYAFEDHFVYIYDVRFLGRGGIVHPFSGMGGAPHFVNFVPNAINESSSDHNSRVLVCSGRKGTPGLQLITPFDENSGDNPDNFFSCYMESNEFVTDMYTSGNELILGTSAGNITQYRMAEDYETKTIHAFGTNVGGSNVGAVEFYPSSTGRSLADGGQMGGTSGYSSIIPQEEKEPLVMPASYVPEIPALSINPTVLHSNTESVFNSFILCANPKLTALHSEEKAEGIPDSNTFGPLAKKPLLIPPKRKVSDRVMNAAIKQDGDYMATVKTEYLELDLLPKEPPKTSSEKNTRRNTASPNKKYDPSLNSNKLLYCREISKVVYDTTKSQKTSAWGKRRAGFDTYQDEVGDQQEEQLGDGVGLVIPRRYRCTFRPTYVGPSSFDHAKFNSTGLWPGWEYPPSASNSTIPPVLLMLYFVGDVRSAMLGVQSDALKLSPHQQNQNNKYMTLSQEIGFLFHQIENISAHAMTYPQDISTGRGEKARVGAFVPYNFLTTFTSMPEAESLALLDGAPAATTTARRPEAFYRFLLHHIDKELTSKNCAMLMDSLHGLDFTSVNEFLSGSSEPPTVSCTRGRSVDLGYEPFIEKNEKPLFGEVLRHSLCKESRLRAWCKGTRTYETVVQRKIATSLPQILSLCCSCAGERFEKDRLPIWRTKPSTDGGLWLPEMIEIQLEKDGNVVVRELQGEKWIEFKGDSSLPCAVSEKLIKESSEGPRTVKYRLTSVLSFIRDDKASNISDEQTCEGHHVLQVRVPSGYKKRALRRQQEATNNIISAKEAPEGEFSGDGHDDEIDLNKWTLTANTNKTVYKDRCEYLQNQIDSALSSKNDSENDWVIINGFVAANTTVEDVRDFHSPFKEPALVTYSAVDGDDDLADNRGEEVFIEKVPVEVLDTRSISTGQPPQVPKVRELISEKDLTRRPWLITKSPSLPAAGELIAFDAEFVQVQDEDSVLTDSGSKVTVREARNALARISLIDCSNDNVLIDDYILPREPVVDYLTRFSGIVAKDLHPKQSPHHLVTMRSAYLKLRLMVERGCIFVGHGLAQDFLMVNLFVPPSQIIDTVEIFHKDRMRYISLRFLANYLLGTDMQQDTHDSIEDATTAHQIYRKAVEFKANGTFDKVLNDIYEFGQKTDWKLGVEESSSPA